MLRVRGSLFVATPGVAQELYAGSRDAVPFPEHGQPIVHLPFMAAGAGAAHLAKILLFKKVGFWGAYGATKVYGWPRVTRTLLQYNKQHTPEAAQTTVQAAIITAIRTPAQAYGVFQDSEVYAFIGKVARSGGDAIPPWVQSIAASIAGKTHV